MLPILSAKQMRAADAFTIAHEPVASIDLMERAAKACAEWLVDHCGKAGERRFIIFCGVGNNGGDGLAIARMVNPSAHHVRVFLVGSRDDLTPDAAINLDRAQADGIPVSQVDLGSGISHPAEDEVVIDALLGTGLDRTVKGLLKEVIGMINEAPGEVISIDMPSGLFAEDNASNDPDAIVRADHVLTFETPKLALLLPENGRYVGQWHLVPIGLDREFIQGIGSRFQLIDQEDARSLLPARARFAHKGTFGHALLIAGGPGRIGAAVIATRSCARSGVGMVTVHVPSGWDPVMHAAVPEAMVTTDASMDQATSLPLLSAFDSVGIGPGVGTDDATARGLKLMIQEASVPLVLDADAINILATNRTWIAFLPKGSILTPHPKEFDRLTAPSTSGHERLMKAKDFAMRYGVVLVLKGAYSAICSPDGMVFFNPTGNPGMAKGGSGDALTGIITGLCAQGLAPLSAAMLGVYAHGLAGDIAAEQLGMDGMMVSDLVDHLPLAWKGIRASA